MLEYMDQGGSIMWIIAALSLAALAAAAERLIFFHKASVDVEKLEGDFGKAISCGDAEGAWRVAKANDGSANRLFVAALAHWGIGAEEMKLLMEQQVRREIYRWEKNLFVLEMIGKIAPLLGLLGTVLGMVAMFRSLHFGGQVNAAMVTGGIWKALFTTVAGLAVAIPTIMVYGFLNAKIDSEEETLERSADFIVREHIASGGGKDGAQK